ncbi:MAG: hypothetical protein GYA41_11700 [Bacteroidales bacterium]|nr:hypothetical protein [Bacteroidales bacterium]
MRKTTKNLEDDHVYILRLIDVIELVAGDPEPDPSKIGEIVYLIKNFADGSHHAKEENILFPFLETRGFSAQSGPVAVMIHEHILGRNYVKGISEGLALYKQGNKAGVVDINRNLLGYIDLLRNHISKENNVLFRMADGVMSDEDDKILISKFDSVTKDNNAGEERKDFIARIEKLAAAYGI